MRKVTCYRAEIFGGGKEMKQLYFVKVKGDTSSLKDFKLDETFKVDKTQNENAIVNIDGVNYRKVDELPRDKDKIITVLGYVEAGKKENQHSNISIDDKRLIGCVNSQYPILREIANRHKVIGYIKIENMDCYIAITVSKSLIPLIAPIVVVGIIICLFVVNLYNPEKVQQPVDPSSFKTGDKGTGDLSTKTTSPMETVYFNINLNATPTIQDNKMNLRVVNKGIVNNEENRLSCVVKVTLVSKADENGNVVKNIDKPILIYESPLIKPSENIENCAIDIPVEPGRYVGRAMYDIYDSNMYLVGHTAARLDIVAK